jgi:hypothetical protein
VEEALLGSGRTGGRAATVMQTVIRSWPYDDRKGSSGVIDDDPQLARAILPAR